MGSFKKMSAKIFGLLCLSFGFSLCQDTYYCPDGWIVSDVGGVVDCILLGGLNELVTKQDAEIICSFHDAWLVDLDEGHGGQKNRFFANLINEEQSNWDGGVMGPHFDHQWWIGATCDGHHDDHDWGYWTWDHAGTEVTWFDWADGEPNDWHRQNCLAYLTFFDPFGFHVTQWNDWDCDKTARYICEKAANNDEKTTEPPTNHLPNHQHNHLLNRQRNQQRSQYQTQQQLICPQQQQTNKDLKCWNDLNLLLNHILCLLVF